MHNAIGRNRRGLGMVELIIILAITGILVGMLLPVISRVRERSRITVCASNLRQIGMAVQSYRGSNRSQLPNARWMPQPFSADPPAVEPLFKRLIGYLPQNSGVYRCPGDANQVYDRCSALSPDQLGISYIYAKFPKNSYAGRLQLLLWDYEGDSLRGSIEPPLHPRHGCNTLYLDCSVSYTEQSQ